jgi:RNA polymerase sigma-70 factor, ECF subfamily
MCARSTSVCAATDAAADGVSEHRIVQHARSGCFYCKNHLFEQNASRLQAFVGRIMWASPDRDDVFQQTITNALRRFEQYRGDSAFLTWLCRIALNEMRQVIRKQRSRRFISIDEETREWPLASQAPSCFDMYRQLEIQKSVYKAVGRRPPTLRAVVELRFLDDLSLLDTANVLGLSLPAVKSRCFRATKLLAKARILRTARNHSESP